jgi:hypothetical protein
MSEEQTLPDNVYRSDASTPGRSSESHPCTNRIAYRTFSSSSFEKRVEVRTSCSQTFQSLLYCPPLLARKWLASGLQRRRSSALLMRFDFSSLFAPLGY